MRLPSRSSLWSHAVALLATGAAALCAEWFRPIFRDAPFLLFIVAIVISAWYGGVKPGLTATVLGYLAASYLLFEPLYSPRIAAPADLVRVLLFALLGAAISGLLGAMHAARRAAQANEAAAREQREQLRVTLTSIGDAVIATDARGCVTMLNREAERLCGWPQAEAVGRPLAEVFSIVNEWTRAPVESPVARAIADGVIVGLANHTILRSRNGVERPIDDSAAPIRNERGEITGVILVFHNVTEKRQAEREREQLLAREREARAEAERERDFIRLVLDHAPMAVVVSEGPEHRIKLGNRSARDLLQLSAGTVRGRKAADILPQAVSQVGEILDRVFRTGIAETVPELRLDLPNDRSVLVQVTYAPLPGPDGAPAGILHLGLDLTARKKAEDSLRFLIEASGGLTRSLELTDVRAAILDLSHRLPTADAHAIWRLRADPDRWEAAHSAGLSPTYLREAARIMGAEIPMSDRPMAVADTTEPSVSAPWAEAYRQEGIASALTMPLRIRGFITGTLALYYCGRRSFDEQTIHLAMALANLAASAIGTAELYERESELRRRAEHADHRKDEFLALLGHELRNPLAPIRNAVDLLGLRPDDASVVGHVRDMIGRQVTQMTRLVDELLDASRIARGKVQLKSEALDWVPLVRAAVEDHRAEVENAGLTLTVQTPDSPLWVWGDAARLTQVVENLLNNACKFTDPGGTVAARLSAEAGRAELTVEDSGIGIAAEALPRLFEAFAQIDAAMERSKGGLGLGLSVVRALVELHDGQVRAASPGHGQGAAFTVTLPLTDRPEPAAPAEEESRLHDGQQRKILIIEDSRDVAESLRLLLSLRGFEVAVAATGAEGVERALVFLPDAIVCDLGLPEMNGFEVARALRADPATAAAVLICMSGYGQEGDRRLAHEAGFDHFLVKPAEITEIHDLVVSAPPPERLIGR